ncbi:MAG: hypothetical protein NZ930_05745 [Candidatus Bipolaricaulota bacterium]|nr:hypothetical protein [Candidatus Bipolaricaulota bacterium]MDW8030498.1 hypothetical protein [Candidatus Bipolaricaulota bacterium]
MSTEQSKSPLQFFVELSGLIVKYLEGGDTVSTGRPKSPLHFFAELGDLIAKYAVNTGFAIGMVIVSWVFWPIGALIASLLIAKLCVQAQTASQPSSPSLTLAPPRSEDWLIFGGLLLIGIGVYALVRQYLPEPPWAVFLIAVGVLLIGVAYARRGGGPGENP